MPWFDTHAHLSDARFEGEAAFVLDRARAAGVTRVLNVFDGTCDPALARRFLDDTGMRLAAVGVHPHDADKGVPDALAAAFADPRFVALGEIGLDYHYDFSPRETQKAIFRAQLEMACALNKPVILHIREAHGDALEILGDYRLPGGVTHCYSGSWESAKAYLDMGLHISFTGSVTFKNARKLLESAQNVPDDRILVETDCPYMAPEPLRGTRNEPANVIRTGAFLARLRGADEEQFAYTAYRNGMRLFAPSEEG